MKIDIHLLYFEGCPNVEEARENLDEALNASGYCGAEWEEVDISGQRVPDGWHGFPSPTILVNGVNIETGERRSKGTSSCRLGGAPAVKTIIKGLEQYSEV